MKFKSGPMSCIEFINQCKVEIVEQKDEDAIHEGEVHLAEVKIKDNTDYGAEIMIVKNRGTELKAKND